jgi:hypothetical protein
MADEDKTGPESEPPPKAYDQEFFLDLALQGKDAWNAWRRDPTNEDVRVTFAGVNFSEAPRDQINFAGFEFGDGANFSGCKWRDGIRQAFILGSACFNLATFGHMAEFTRATFGSTANFVGVTFGHDANFTNAAFGTWARFSPTNFGVRADFTRATFGAKADFVGAIFGHDANFASAAFGAEVRFSNTTFGNRVNFNGANFRDEAQFADAEFQGGAYFISAAFGDGANFTGANFHDDAKFDQTHFEGSVAFNRQRTPFLTISFANARFDGEADFSGRIFDADADFTNARFYYPPDFDAATNHARIDFTGAHVGFVPAGKWLHWTKNSRIPVRLRAFRKIAEETKNHDLERDLYVEERKAERGVYWHQLLENLKKEPWRNWPRNSARLIVHLLWIGVMGLYWALADYGRNFVLPLALLIASVFFFYWRYANILAPLAPKTCPLGDQYEHAVRMVALGNAVPFVGPITIDAEIKKFLFCPGGAVNCLPIPPEGFQLLVLGQKPSFDHPRFFHRPRVAQLFQDQVRPPAESAKSANIKLVATLRLLQIPSSYLPALGKCLFAQIANRTKMFHVKHFGTIDAQNRT